MNNTIALGCGTSCRQLYEECQKVGILFICFLHLYCFKKQYVEFHACHKSVNHWFIDFSTVARELQLNRKGAWISLVTPPSHTASTHCKV